MLVVQKVPRVTKPHPKSTTPSTHPPTCSISDHLRRSLLRRTLNRIASTLQRAPRLRKRGILLYIKQGTIRRLNRTNSFMFGTLWQVQVDVLLAQRQENDGFDLVHSVGVAVEAADRFALLDEEEAGVEHRRVFHFADEALADAKTDRVFCVC